MGLKLNPSKEAVWRDRLARFRKCSQTVKEFCRQEGVSVPSFYQWRKRLGNQGVTARTRARRSSAAPARARKSPPFVPVKVSSWGETPNVSSGIAEVLLPNGVRIRVPATQSEALRVAILTGNEACREVG